MIKKLTYFFILSGFIGLFTLIPGSVDRVIYYYFRITDGSAIELSKQCYSLPDGWVIDSIEKGDERKIYNLRLKVKREFKFASVFHGTRRMVPNIQNLIPLYEVDDYFKIYELSALPSKNTVRFWALVPKNNLIIMSSEIDVLKSLSLNFRPFSC